MTRTASLLVVPVALCLACSSGSRLPPAPPAATTLAGSQEAAPQVPLRVKWRVLSDSGGHLLVEAVVERFAQLAAPVVVSVRVPQGLTLLAGQTQFDVEAGGRTGETVQAFEFSYVGAPPVDDLEPCPCPCSKISPAPPSPSPPMERRAALICSRIPTPPTVTRTTCAWPIFLSASRGLAASVKPLPWAYR